MIRRLCISFSGGETSAFMAQWLLKHWRDRYDEIVVTFANTSQESEETLAFVARCDIAFSLGVVWLEAVVPPERGQGIRSRVVSHHTACRDGSVFEAVVAKYGIPNKRFSFCSQYLKRRAIEHYLRGLGWRRNTYDVAIGIRLDEIDRMREGDAEVRLVYPLISDAKMTKPKINTWWAAQPFRLNLKGYQGNCRWCWKKSLRKHITLMREDPTIYDFPMRMEALYQGIGPEYNRPGDPPPPGYMRTFFRENRSTMDLIQLAAAAKNFTAADDDAQVFDPDYDVGEGCEESCEVY